MNLIELIDRVEMKKMLFFLLGLSLAVKLFLLIALQYESFNPDGLLYISAAEKISQGHFREALSIYRMPLYPLLITMVHFFVSDWALAGKLVSLILAVLTLIPLYLISIQLFSRAAAFWACLAFALSPVPNYWAVEILRGPSYLFVFAWTIYFALKAIQTTRPIFFVLAIAFSLLIFLLRVEGIIFIPVFILFLLFLVTGRGREKKRYRPGFFIYTGFWVFIGLVGSMLVGGDLIEYNRIDEVIESVTGIFNLSFLDNYFNIYDQLVALEDSSPYPGGKQNFAEIARHYMPLIYLLGIFETVIRILFPLFLIPLIWGFRNTMDRQRIFLITMTGSYLFFIYFTLIEGDFIQKRFLSAPVFLLYPWVGAGLTALVNGMKKRTWPKWLITVILALFIALPLSKIFDTLGDKDDLKYRAGKWLASQPAMMESKIVTTDKLILFFAGLKYYDGKGEKYVYLKSSKHKIKFYAIIEKYAKDHRMDVIIVAVSKKDKRLIPRFTFFKKCKSFDGKKDYVEFHVSPKIYGKLQKTTAD
jgi:4-amino-4-deoxy-L-arabinose transferase-like glycosyltransferase